MGLDQQRQYRKSQSVGHSDTHGKLRPPFRRRAEDVDYWRKQAGWFDDDETMQAYNNGVYENYYNVDDDNIDWTQWKQQNNNNGGDSIEEEKSDVMMTTIKVVGIVAGICLLVYVFRLLTRGETKKKDKKEKKKKSSSASESRTRSKSRSRSRSRSRRGDYDLMEDKTNDSEARSKRSSRSKSRSSRSRSRTRSRSKTADTKTEAVLV